MRETKEERDSFGEPMLPLPITDTGAPPSGRPVDVRGPKTTLSPEQEGEEFAFAATLALESDQDTKLSQTPEAEVEIEIATVKADASAELPDIAALETPKTRPNAELAQPQIDRKQPPVRLDASRILSRDDALTPKLEGQPEAAMATKPALTASASMAQRLVEGQMPAPQTGASPEVKGAITEAPKSPVPAAAPKAANAELPEPASDETIKIVSTSKEAAPKMVEAPARPKVFVQDKPGISLPDEALSPKLNKPDLPVAPRNPQKAAQVITRDVPVAALTMPHVQMMEEALKPTNGFAHADTELTQTLLVSERPAASASQTITTTSASYGAETARSVAQQLGNAVGTQTGRVTEIALHPEELGRVRLAMTSVDATITLSVVAERPETADLLRRHIDVLAQEFRDLGYDEINFSFDGDEESHDEPAADTLSGMGETPETSEGPPTAMPGSITGLDLRM